MTIGPKPTTQEEHLLGEIYRLKTELKTLSELEHKIAEVASACGVPHDCDFESTETLERIKDWFLELKADLSIAKAVKL